MRHELSVALCECLSLTLLHFPRSHLNPVPSPTALIPLSSFPHLHLLIFPRACSLSTPLRLPCLMLPPCSPDSTNYWGVATWSEAQQGSHAVRKQNFTSLWLSHYTRRYEAERLWHISGMPRKLICASPSPWHRLNPISHFIVSRHSWSHTQVSKHRFHMNPG